MHNQHFDIEILNLRFRDSDLCTRYNKGMFGSIMKWNHSTMTIAFEQLPFHRTPKNHLAKTQIDRKFQEPKSKLPIICLLAEKIGGKSQEKTNYNPTIPQSHNPESHVLLQEVTKSSKPHSIPRLYYPNKNKKFQISPFHSQLFSATKQDKIRKQTKESVNHKPQGDIWSLPSWAHEHYHAAHGTPHTSPDFHHPSESCTPPNNTTTKRSKFWKKILRKQTQAMKPKTRFRLRKINKQIIPGNQIEPMNKNPRIPTLISLKGIRRLFSSLESNPRMREAWRKLRLVAARAFIATKNDC